METVVEPVLGVHGKTIFGHQGRPVITPGEALGNGVILQHPVQGDDVRALGLRIAEPGIAVVIRGDRADDHLDTGGIGHFRHRGDVRHDLVLGDALGKVVGTAHDNHHLRVQVDDIRLEASEHLGGVLPAHALVQIAVSGKESGMETSRDIIAAHGHEGRKRIQGNQDVTLIVRT